MILSELQTEYLKDALAFLDAQKILHPSFNSQVGFDFQGFRRSFLHDPEHPDSRSVAQFGRVWIYDVALSIYADLKTGRTRSAGYQVGRAIQLSHKETELGYKGLWHFSYNTDGDSFIDPRGPLGCNCWCLSSIYAFILASGDAVALAWANRMVQEYLFSSQVMDSQDPRYGLIRAGMHNPEDSVHSETMGYHIYKGNPNQSYEHIVLEHNVDAAGTFRMAFRATTKYARDQKDFLNQLIHRHDLLLQAMRRGFWQEDHFVSAMDEKGEFYKGTDGLPSIAVDNNTWAAHVFLPYDIDLIRSSIRYVQDHFVTQVPPALLEGASENHDGRGLKGLFYFPATFSDPFVQVPDEHRSKMEILFHPEATFGLILFLKDASEIVPDQMIQREYKTSSVDLYENIIKILRLYHPPSSPYATANVPNTFSTLHSLTTAATGAITTRILQGNSAGDFIGVLPPEEFLVNGQPPLRSSED